MRSRFRPLMCCNPSSLSRVLVSPRTCRFVSPLRRLKAAVGYLRPTEIEIFKVREAFKMSQALVSHPGLPDFECLEGCQVAQPPPIPSR